MPSERQSPLRMARVLPKRWLHPQAVPRGFLRLYILAQLARGPETGYSIMQKIDEKTDGAWKPGPGTIYPMLKGLVSDGLSKTAEQGAPGKSYAISPKGRKELEEMRARLSNMGRRERVLSRLFSDILSPTVMVPAMVGRYRDGNELFRKMISQLPRPEREYHLREVKLFLESQVQWIDSQLEETPLAPRPSARKRR